jgi:hypothetical protein
VKKLAKLVLFFSLSFAILFLTAAILRFLSIRVEWVRALPRGSETRIAALIAAARWALSLGLYGTLLIGLSYAARRQVSALMTAACLFVLPLAFSFGIFLGLEQLGNLESAQATIKVLGEPGLILSNSPRPSDTVIILLGGPTESRGPRVAAIPGQPLIYQAEPAGPGNASLPPVSFRDDSPWFLKSIAIDLWLSAQELEERIAAGLLPFLIYAGALILLLGSLGCVFKLSAWPLVNLFLGCLAFRGILALETFFNSPEIQTVFESFLRGRLPLSLAVPLIFCVSSVVVYLYSILVYLAKWRPKNEN